jgi:hypothetical protein
MGVFRLSKKQGAARCKGRVSNPESDHISSGYFAIASNDRPWLLSQNIAGKAFAALAHEVSPGCRGEATSEKVAQKLLKQGRRHLSAALAKALALNPKLRKKRIIS